MSSIDLEYVNCNLCREDKTELLFTVRDPWYRLPIKFNMVKCGNCGLVYLNPRPAKKILMEYYLSGDWVPPDTKSRTFKRKLAHKWMRIFRGDLRSLDNLPKGKVLDVGYGSGMLLKSLQDKGWEIYGVDINPALAKRVEILGLNLFIGELEEANFKDNYFDAVIIDQSLEHMPDPLAVLMEIRRVTKANGTLIVGVPNIGCRSAKIFGQYWAGINAPQHLYHFTPYTLKLMLERAEFTASKIDYEPALGLFLESLSYLINKRGQKLLNILGNQIITVGLYYPFSAIITRIFHQGPRMVLRAKKL